MLMDKNFNRNMFRNMMPVYHYTPVATYKTDRDETPSSHDKPTATQ